MGCMGKILKNNIFIKKDKCAENKLSERENNMNIIKKIIIFFKNKICKKNNLKMIDSAKDFKQKEDQKSFVASLKIEKIPNPKKKKVETLVSPGDGLGIENKISY